MSMQRPVMDVMYLQDDGEHTPRPKRFRDRLIPAWRLLQKLLRVLFSQPVHFRRRGANFVDPTPISVRIVKGALYRLLFVPVLLALAAAAFVFAGTHPLRADPPQVKVPGVYYETVQFTSPDGTKLEGWYVPVIDAKRVLEERDKLLRKVHPAVVLVHDFNQSPQQVLPLVEPLHEDGFMVLVVGLRGAPSSGTSGGSGIQAKGQTFGLNEAQDVQAAIDALRDRPYVDGERIAVVGVGTGANAALLAARTDGHLAALVLADPVRKPDEVIARRIGPDRRGLRWMQPLCKWAFQVAYHVDAQDLELDRHRAIAESPKTLMLSDCAEPGGAVRPEMIEQARGFLQGHLGHFASASAAGE